MDFIEVSLLKFMLKIFKIIKVSYVGPLENIRKLQPIELCFFVLTPRAIGTVWVNGVYMMLKFVAFALRKLIIGMKLNILIKNHPW